MPRIVAEIAIATAGLLLLALLGGCRAQTTPARASQASCASDEVRICLGQCRRAASFGQPCTPGRDECAAEYIPCGAGLTCDRDPGDTTQGRCGASPPAACD